MRPTLMPKPRNDNPPGPRIDERRWPYLLAGTLVAGPALLPLVAGFLPRLYFETDPRAGFAPEMITAFGPAGAAIWQVVCVAAAAIAMSLYLWLGGRVRWAWVALAAAGAVAALWQSGRHAGNMLPAGAWLAGASLALAAAHVGGFRQARRWMIAMVVAMMVPVGLQAGYDVLLQKPRDIAHWQQHEVELLEQRGIVPGSPQHELLERRAFSEDATGPFGFSNALGTLSGGGAVLAIFVGVGMWRGASGHDRECRLVKATPWLAGGFGCAAVWFTHSTGALGAVVIACVLVGVSFFLLRTRLRWGVPWLAIGAVATPIAAVLARGAAGPPDSMAGERSLLFRQHYWEASARMMQDQLPGSLLPGVGPFGFKEGYLLHKNPLNPETVASAHSVFVDWAVYLGLGGIAWCVLMLIWLWCSGNSVVGSIGGREASEPSAGSEAQAVRFLHRPEVVAALVVAALLFGTQYALQSAMMDASLALVWLVGAVGFVAVASAVGRYGTAALQWERLGLLAMGTVVLVHSQIEMGFALIATAVPCWFMVGLAASGSTPPDAGRALPAANRSAGFAMAAGLLLVVWLSVSQAAPLVRHQTALAEASRQLAAGQPYRGLASLERAEEALPTDPTAARWIAILRRDEMLTLAQRGDTLGAREAFGLALRPVDRLISHGTAGVGILRLRAQLLLEASNALGDLSLRAEAIAEYERVAELSPFNLFDAVRLGDLHAAQGDDAQACAAYERALRIDEQMYLDDAMQMDDATRRRVYAALQAAAGRDRASDDRP